jgi:positive regulator of sigma E activity
MRALLIFLVVQIIIYILGMSDVMTISLIVLGTASIIFAFAYLSAFGRDKRNQKRIIKAALETQQN